MARLTFRSPLLTVAGLLLLTSGIAACGMPQSTEPAAPVATLEAPAELLGGPDIKAEMPAMQQAQAAPTETRRPGWGTMAPIPNPEDGGRRATYLAIGPTAAQIELSRAETVGAARTSRQVRIATTPPSGPATPRTPTLKRRVRHWIVPVANTRP